MDLPLQQFISGMVTIGDVRNIDVLNPVVVLLEQPVTGTQFVTVAAMVEPSYLGVPLYTTWVVMDPNNRYYLQALHLVDVLSPSTTAVANVVQDGGFQLSWVVESTYAEIFTPIQHYVQNIAAGPAGPAGPQGPAGPAGTVGPQGPQGPAPVVDYTYLLNQIIQKLNQGSSLAIVGPSQVIEGKTGQYQVQLTTYAGTANVTSQITIQNPQSGVSVDASNLLTVGLNSLNGDTNVTLLASFVLNGVTLPATLSVLLRNSIPVSLALTGLPSTMIAGAVAQLSSTVTYSNGQTANVTTTSTYVSSNTSALTVSGVGAVTTLAVGSNQNVTVSSSYTEGSTTVTGSEMTVVDSVIPVSMVITGLTTVAASATSQYVATATYNNGVVAVVTGSTTFGLTNPALGSFSASGGLLTAAGPNADTTGSVTGSYTSAGVTVTATLAITVQAVIGISPYYGTAPKNSTIDATLVLGLPNRLPGPSQVGTFTLNSGAPGSGISMFFAYPASYGWTRFMDEASPGFYGGWDGALGNPSDPSKWGPATISIVVAGVSTPFYVYQTDYDGLGSVTWDSSVSATNT